MEKKCEPADGNKGMMRRENMKSRYDMLLMNLRLGHNNYMGPTFLTSVLLFSKQLLTVITPHHTFYHKNKQPSSIASNPRHKAYIKPIRFSPGLRCLKS